MTTSYFTIIVMNTKYRLVLYETALLAMSYCRCVWYESNGFQYYSQHSVHLPQLHSSGISLTGDEWLFFRRRITNYL